MHLAARTVTSTPASLSPCLLNALGPFEHAPHLAVAVSGGADSMALALMAHDWATAHGGRITALTIDHGLRAASAQEVTQVQAWLHARGIACEILRIAVPPDGNVQAAARDARYHALTQWCRTHHVLHLCVGHHADDQAETTALHGARGHTTDGDSGMPLVTQRDGVRLLRPLLTHRKTELEAYLQTQHQAWIDDPSNASDAFARNRLRGTLDVPALLHAAQAAGHTRHTRETVQAAHSAQCITLYPEGYALLDLARYRALDADSASLLLANVLRTLGGGASRPRGHETVRLHTVLIKPEACNATLAGFRIRSDGMQACFTRELARMQVTAPLPPSGSMRYDGRFHLHWRGLPDGCHIAPLGSVGKKQLDAPALSVPKGVIESLPAWWHLEEVLSVPHIAFTRPGRALADAVQLAFVPAKPLAASPFWCLNAGENT